MNYAKYPQSPSVLQEAPLTDVLNKSRLNPNDFGELFMPRTLCVQTDYINRFEIFSEMYNMSGLPGDMFYGIASVAEKWQSTDILY